MRSASVSAKVPPGVKIVPPDCKCILACYIKSGRTAGTASPKQCAR